MTSEQLKEFDALKQRVAQLERVENVSFIESLRRRFSFDDFVQLQTVTKGVNSEDITINEDGTGTKIALDDPDGFIKIGPNQNIPIYND